MILSTVNFVNNYKFSDFILTKITEEQKEIDSETVKKTKRHSFGAVSRRVSVLSMYFITLKLQVNPFNTSQDTIYAIPD